MARVRVTEMPSSSGGLTDAELRAVAVPVSQASQPLPAGAATSAKQDSEIAALGAPTDAEATGNGSIIAVLKRIRTLLSGALTVTGTFWQATQPVSGPVTNAELRAAPVPVSLAGRGPFSFVSAKTAAPAANAVQCDSGQLPAGDYELEIQLAISDTVAVGKGLVIEHRNAANSANINVLGGCTPGETVDISIDKIAVALNERIRVIAGTAAGAASSMYVSSIGRRLAA